MISEEDRLALHDTLRDRLGDRAAATLMTRLFAFDPAQLATKHDLAELRAELRGEIAELRSEVRGEFARLEKANARQTLQLTLTILAVFVAQFAATVGVVVGVVV